MSSRREPIASPCTGVCQLDASDVCQGCYRTRYEIAGWSIADDGAQRAIVARCRLRCKTRRVVGASDTSRDGFTVVELLVVLAVIGILIGLLMPAVQATREAARRVSCANNLKQIGLGLHAYHGSHGSLPIGCLEWRGWNSPPTQRQFAWSAMLLPYLDQGTVHAGIDFSLPYDHPDNRAAAETRIVTYLCPSSPERPPGLGLGLGPTDYGGLYGERLVDPRSRDGVFLYDEVVRFADIHDGLTETLAVAEDVGGPDAFWIDGRNVFEQAFGINDPDAPWFDNEIRSDHPGGAQVLFCGGQVQFLSESIDRQVLGALITRANHEIIDADLY